MDNIEQDPFHKLGKAAHAIESLMELINSKGSGLDRLDQITLDYAGTVLASINGGMTQ